jgi:beta-phosphoglucomutase
VRALLLDFNGTLSDDEPLLCRIFQELFDEVGRPLTDEVYFSELVGLSDAEIVERWLGEPRPDLLERKSAIYRREAYMGETITDVTRFALKDAAHHVQLGVVSGSARDEIEAVLAAAQLLTTMTVIVAAEDVLHGKPDPEGYRRALHALRVKPEDCVAVEDSEVGVAAAKAAELYCIAVTTTMDPERLSEADELADRFDGEFVRGLLSRS